MVSKTSELQRKKRDDLNRLVRQVALHVDPMGKISTLATKSGLNYTSLMAGLRRGHLTEYQAIKIEECVGTDVVTRKKLCPELSK